MWNTRAGVSPDVKHLDDVEPAEIAEPASGIQSVFDDADGEVGARCGHGRQRDPPAERNEDNYDATLIRLLPCDFATNTFIATVRLF